MKKLTVIAVLLLSACTTPTPQPQDDAPTQAQAAVSPDAFRAHVNFLASDLLEGREAGTRGYDIAAAYVATQFELMGLSPAGDNGSFMQSVPLRASWREADRIRLALQQDGSRTELTFKQDFLLRNAPQRTEAVVEAETVFVGYGIDAPNRGHNDYDGLDVRGKVAVVLTGYPAGWPSEEGAFYSSGATKSRTAEAHGAIAMIYVYTDAIEKVSPWERMTRNPDAMAMSWVGKDGVPHSSAPSIRLSGIVTADVGNALFEGAPLSYSEVRKQAVDGAPAGFPLSVRLDMAAGSRQEDRTSANVAGMVIGTDPALRNEHVVLTAHLDHLGIGPPVDGDAINNGALDNAAGIAAMLEAARSLQADPPRRSVIFLAVTAEEKGLLGSEYFALNPTVPIDAIVANVNLDMPVLLYDFKDLIGFGATHSSIEGTMRDALASMGLGLSPDPFPERAIFVRSDHFRFVQQGVPSIMLATGSTSSEGEGKGLEVFIEFLTTHYHRPSDDPSRPIDYAAGMRFGEVNYRLLKAIANADEAPTWNEGDFFGERFGR
ncbi:MAG: M28 family metallopeptidase [Pseudomonadota bacterium]